MKQIVISTSSFAQYEGSYLQRLKDEGYEVILNPYKRKVKGEELIELARDSVGLIAGTETLNEEILSSLPDLKVISRCGVGMDSVDQEAAKRLSIKVFNTPDAPTLPVVELVLGMILSLLRKVGEMDRAIRKGVWKKQMGHLLSGKRVGIIGYGRIGRKLSEVLRVMGCDTIYSDPFVEGGIPLDDLLKTSDIISIHVSVSNQILSEKEFNLMKKGVWLINASRGGVLDETILYNYLKDKKLSGAAIDVFSEEPYDGPLRELDNVILTPHIGSYAMESRIEMERQSVDNLLTGLKN